MNPRANPLSSGMAVKRTRQLHNIKSEHLSHTNQFVKQEMEAFTFSKPLWVMDPRRGYKILRVFWHFNHKLLFPGGFLYLGSKPLLSALLRYNSIDFFLYASPDF